MQRSSVLIVAAFLSACATRAPSDGPVPADHPAQIPAPSADSPAAAADADAGRVTRDQPDRADTATRPRTGSDSLIDAEIAAEIESAADSVADADALEELAGAHPAGESDYAEAVTWDIDVATFSEHDRVQYYLSFFTGSGRERKALRVTCTLKLARASLAASSRARRRSWVEAGAS